MNSEYRLYSGFVINPTTAGAIEYFPNGALVVDNRGKIAFCGNADGARSKYGAAREMGYGDYIITPGLVDAHVHLPQFGVRGIGTGEMLDWLERYIYPLEIRFADEDFARGASAEFFRAALACGSTLMAVYCTSHYAATNIAFQAAYDAGVRVVMGNSLIERDAPAGLIPNAAECIRSSLALARAWHGVDNGRLLYALTPRYAGSCTMELMQECAHIAKSEGLHIQTHLAESVSEVAYISSLFPEAQSYTDVYDRAGLLGSSTILAHCIHLEKREYQTLIENNCAVAHCPTSNRFLQSGVMPLKKYCELEMNVGLGSDVAGGYSLSMLHEAREACESSKTLNIIEKNYGASAITPERAFWLVTLGGARALGLERYVGNFENGKDADFVLFDRFGIVDSDTQFDDASDCIARLLYLHNGQAAKVYVRGMELYNA